MSKRGDENMWEEEEKNREREENGQYIALAWKSAKVLVNVWKKARHWEREENRCKRTIYGSAVAVCCI